MLKMHKNALLWRNMPRRHGRVLGGPSNRVSGHVGSLFEVDGTDDGENHCLKVGGAAADACKTITMQTANILSRGCDIENEDKLSWMMGGTI